MTLRLSLLVTSWRGNPTGDEESLVEDVRARLNELPKKATVAQQQHWFCWGFSLIVDYAVAAFSLNVLTALTNTDFGERL